MSESQKTLYAQARAIKEAMAATLAKLLSPPAAPAVNREQTREPVVNVTLGVIAYNEAELLPDLLEDIAHQDYPHGRIELILVDSCSEDGTGFVMQDFARRTRDFALIQVLKNYGRYQPQGWNIVLDNYHGDVLIRLDAHARIAADFVSASLACLNRGEDVCGGPRPMIFKQKSDWGATLLAAEQSAFGSSPAAYRRKPAVLKEPSAASSQAQTENQTQAEEQSQEEPEAQYNYVSSVFHPAYRRTVIDAVGRFDERLQRTEDNNYSARLHQAGYRICYDPAIRSYQYLRTTLSGLLKQKAANGFWIGATLFISPASLQPFHLVPALFVLALLAALILGLFVSWIPGLVFLLLYLLADLGLSVQAARQSAQSNLTMLALPFVFLAIHLSYGAASLCGWRALLKTPLKKTE